MFFVSPVPCTCSPYACAPCTCNMRVPYVRAAKQSKNSWSCAAYLLQRCLHSTLDCVPTTAGSAQFCLLCCQPEPFPESLPARPPSLTRRCPCSLPVWLGQSIDMGHRTFSSPRHSISHTPTWGTERCDPPQILRLHRQTADNMVIRN